jgi:beta-phosphoglucomutase-like phosphatase (HAD superfamily)
MATRARTRPAAERGKRLRARRPPVERPPSRLELDTVASSWQLALDSAERALAAAAGSLTGDEVGRRRRRLERERRSTAELLASLARTAGVQPAPWLSPVPVTAGMLGLPSDVRGCLFDLDGVLSDSGRLHAWAWGEAFDAFLFALSERTGWQFIPFDREADYRAYVDGRPRLEGVHAFLDSRGIRLPEGRPGDRAGSGTAYGLAAQKSAILQRGLQERGVNALAGARRYLEAAGRAGLGRAVVSASANTDPMLEIAGLTPLVQAQVDAAAMKLEGLRARPAPDILLSACGKLGVPPESVVSFTHTPEGVAAGHAAGMLVIGVAADADGEVLRGFGADRVVPALVTLLERRLAAR